MPRTPLIDPDGFFREHPDPSLQVPAILLVVVSIVQAILHEGILIGLRGSLELLFVFPGVVLVSFGAIFVAGLVVFPLYWMGVAGFFYVVSLWFDGSGTFRRVVAYFGWMWAPYLLGLLVVGIPLLVVFPEGVISVAEDRFFVEAFTERLTLIIRMIQAVSLLVTLWTAYIWVYALKHGRGLTRRAATITIGVPIGIQLFLWIALQLFYPPI